MDHRAVKQAEKINASNSPVLQYCGGALSPEMQPPKVKERDTFEFYLVNSYIEERLWLLEFLLFFFWAIEFNFFNFKEWGNAKEMKSYYMWCDFAIEFLQMIYSKQYNDSDNVLVSYGLPKS